MHGAEFNDFRGGMNKAASPHAIGENEVVDLRDAIIDQEGAVRRRGKYGYRTPAITLADDEIVLAMNRQPGHSDTRGIWMVTTNFADDKTHVYYALDDGTEYKAVTFDGASKNAQIAMTYTSPANETGDTIYNAQVIATDAMTIILKVAMHDADFAPDAAYQTKWHRTLDTGVVRHFQLTCLAGDHTKVHPCDGVGAGGWLIPNDLSANLMGDRPLSMVATVGLYTFLAGDSKDDQQIWWSGVENGFDWDWNRQKKAGETGTGKITGLAAVNGSLAIFRRNQITMLHPTTSISGWDIKDTEHVGVIDGASIAKYEDGVIFAGEKAVYHYDGYTLTDLSSDKLGAWYRTIIRRPAYEAGTEQNYNTNWQMAGAVYGDYYFLSISDITGEKLTDRYGLAFGTLVCHVPTKAWSIWGVVPAVTTPHGDPENGTDKNVRLVDDFKFTASCLTELETSVYVAKVGVNHKIVDIGLPIRGLNGPDPAGTGPEFSMTTGVITGGGQYNDKRFRRIQTTYEGIKNASDTPKLNVAVKMGMNVEGDYVVQGYLPDNTELTKKRIKLGHRTDGISIRFKENRAGGNFKKLSINGLKIAWMNLRDGMA